MIAELLTTLPRFAEQELAPYLEDWQALDIHYKKSLQVQKTAAHTPKQAREELINLVTRAKAEF